MRVRCRWNVGEHRAGTIIDLPDSEAYRLEKLGAVSIIRLAPGEKMPGLPDEAVADIDADADDDETEPTPVRRSGRRK